MRENKAEIQPWSLWDMSILGHSKKIIQTHGQMHCLSQTEIASEVWIYSKECLLVEVSDRL